MNAFEIVGVGLIALGGGFAIMAAVLYMVILIEGDDEN